MAPESIDSSTATRRCWMYDVFLSFRGEDNRKTFTDHLYTALDRRGIFTFRDDERLERGKAIAPELFKAIEESRYAIVVFSANYADSKWCLDELVKILESMEMLGQTVLPVFYNVDPSDVRKQTGFSFEKAFAKHEEEFGRNSEKVRKWRNALREATNLSGWHLQDRHEAVFIQEIVDNISSKLSDRRSNLAKGLVGMNDCIKELSEYLGAGLDDIRTIGICGMGGIGKTTIAKVVYQRMSHQFEGFSFLANVREVSKTHGLVRMQEQLLSQILMESCKHIWDVDSGICEIRNRLCRKRVLVILDDVDKLEQVKLLVGEHDCFSSGSRIIITTRDKHLLREYGVNSIYHVKELNDDDALLLFSRKAFKNDHPVDEYLDLSNQVVNYAKGLPLALEVLGSFLFDRQIKEWRSALDRLKEIPDGGIMNILQISFYGLHEREQKIFLDIACFFKGKKKDRATRILDSCGFYADIGIRVLIDKSLITISNDKLWMHDLVQQMGREIIRQESIEEPGKRSRLWLSKDIYHVLMNDTGTQAVGGIFLHLCEEEEAQLNSKAFSLMDNLRLLKIRNVHFSQGPEYLPNELRFLKWHKYPSKSLPLSFQPKELLVLNMCYSHIEQLWKGTKVLKNLKVIKLSHSVNLTRTPEFSGIPNLERLVLEGCTSLFEVHPSIGVLKRLILLNLKNCKCLTSLPTYIEMESLEILILSGCSKLKKFPEVSENMEHVVKLSLDGTAIEELPLSIERLTGLVYLNLRGCNNLKRLPTIISSFKSLKILNLSGCSKLDKVPENLGHVECLEELDISGTAIRQPPSSIVLLKKLRLLSFRGCNGANSRPWSSLFSFWLFPRSSSSMGLLLPSSLSGLSSLKQLDLSDCNLLEGGIPSDLGSLSALEILNLSRNNFVSLPSSIRQLSKLRNLYLVKCERLQSLPELPSGINHVQALGIVENQCCNIPVTVLKRYLQVSHLKDHRLDIVVPGSEIPKWFSYQSVGSSISIQLPSEWRNSQWTGFAACVTFSVKNTSVSLNNALLYCYISGEENNQVSFQFRLESGHVETDQLWLTYFPRRSRSVIPSNWFESCSEIRLSFGSRVSALELKKCALRLVYEQDVEDINTTIIEPSLKKLDVHRSICD